jgi:phage gp29-like protein
MTAVGSRPREADREVDGAQSSGDHPVVLMTPDQRVRLQQLLEDELRAAMRAATEAGARPGDLAATLAERRRAVEQLLVDSPEDLEHPADQRARGESIGEQGR